MDLLKFGFTFHRCKASHFAKSSPPTLQLDFTSKRRSLGEVCLRFALPSLQIRASQNVVAHLTSFTKSGDFKKNLFFFFSYGFSRFLFCAEAQI